MKEKNGGKKQESRSIDFYILKKKNEIIESPVKQGSCYNPRDKIPSDPVKTKDTGSHGVEQGCSDCS